MANLVKATGSLRPEATRGAQCAEGRLQHCQHSAHARHAVLVQLLQEEQWLLGLTAALGGDTGTAAGETTCTWACACCSGSGLIVQYSMTLHALQRSLPALS